MGRKVVLLAVASTIIGAAFLFGVRLTLVDTPAAKTLRDIVYDGGPVQQIWSGFSATMLAYIGPLLALLVLGCSASCVMYLVFWFALTLFGRLAVEARKTIIDPLVQPFVQLASAGNSLASGGVAAVKGGIGAVKDGAGRAMERGADVAKAGVGTAMAAKEAVVNVAANIGGLWPSTAKEPASSDQLQLNDMTKRQPG